LVIALLMLSPSTKAKELNLKIKNQTRNELLKECSTCLHEIRICSNELKDCSMQIEDSTPKIAYVLGAGLLGLLIGLQVD
jgi:hypothetical protein